MESHFSFVWYIDIMLFPHASAQPEIFQGRGGFVELGHFDKDFVKNTRNKGPTGKNFEVFSTRYC